MKYLIDSNWIIFVLKNKGDYGDKIRKMHSSGLAVSSISVAEVLTGIVGGQEEISEMAVLDEFLGLVSEIPFDHQVTDLFAKIRKKLLKNHVPLENFDIAIAATAIKNDLVLLTDDRKHFERIEGLKIFKNER